MSLLVFPNELLLQIASNLDIPTTNALARTNHRLNSLFSPTIHALACASDQDCTTAIFLASVTKNIPLITYLLTHGTDTTICTPDKNPPPPPISRSPIFNNYPFVTHLPPRSAEPPPPPTILLYHRHPREFDFSSSLTNIATISPNIIVQDRKYGKTPLHFAAENGNERLVLSLIKYGHPINIKDHDFDSALLGALKNHHTSIATLLINRGANIHAEARRGHTTFHLTAAWGHESIVSLMLDKGAKLESRDRDGHTVLHDAAQTGKESMVKMLLNRGANINARVVEREWGDTRGRIQIERDGDTPLLLAVRRGHTNVVNVLLRAGADTSIGGRDGESVADIAKERGYDKIVMLLERSRISAREKGSDTPLHRAAYRNDTHLTITLLSKRANVNARNKTGETPLHVAVEEDSKEVAQMLLDVKGCEIDAQSIFGETALYKAVVMGNVDMVKMLLERGADKDVKNMNGRMVVEIARNLEFRRVVRLLEETGTVGVTA